MSTKAEELADALEKLEATGWGGDCFALTDYSEKQAELAAAELRRLAEVERQYLALRASIGEPVYQFRKLYCADWYDGRPDYEDGGGLYEIRTLYAIKDNQP